MAYYFVFFIIAALNLISGMTKKKSNVLFAVALFVIFVLMTFNYKGPDIGVYMAEYTTVGNSANPLKSVYMEGGYTFLTLIFCKMGLDFFAFRAAVTVIILSLFVSTIRYYKVQGNLIVGFYMLYLFFFDTIQLRNCIVQFIVLFSTRYLFQRSNFSTLKFLICIAIAGSIHIIALVYSSLILIKLFRKKSFYKNLFIFVLVLFAAFVALQPVLPQIASMLSKLLSRGVGYMSGTIKFGWIIVFALYILGLGALYLCKSKIVDKRVKDTVELIIKVNIILGLFLPLTFFNNNFNRIFRNNLILTFIGLTLIYRHSALRDHRRTAFCALTLINVGWIYSDLFARYELSRIIDPIFESNLLLNGLAGSKVLIYVSVVLISLLIVKIVKSIFVSKRHARKTVGRQVKGNLGGCT